MSGHSGARKGGERVEEGIRNWWAGMCHAVGSLAGLGSGLWSLVSLFRGARVRCEVVVWYGWWLGYGIGRNALLCTILGLPYKWTEFFLSEMWCVWFRNLRFTRVCTHVGVVMGTIRS